MATLPILVGSFLPYSPLPGHERLIDVFARLRYSGEIATILPAVSVAILGGLPIALALPRGGPG